MEKFNFNPPNIFIDESIYPDPINTDESREQLSRPHHQMREFINELVDEVNREKSSDEISYKHDNLSAVTNVKQGLDEHYRLIKETQNHLNDSDENFNTHKNNNEIHVTSSEKSRWNNTYTKDETDAAISRKVVQIGAGDMAQHIYDKDGDGKVDHAELADEAKIADYAKKTSIAQTVSGDFITVETAKESGGALTIHGKTHQKTYSGKNLYDVTKIGRHDAITIESDGWVSINRDNTSGTSRVYVQPNATVSNLLKPNTEYTIVCEIASGSGFAYFQYVSTAADHKSQFNTTAAATNTGTHIAQAVTFNDFSASVSMLRSVIAIDAGQKCSLKFRYSVIEGSNVTAENFVYEPFTNGILVPNPDYPQEVNGVVASAKRTGKNLLKVTGASKTESGITYTVNSDGSITVNGTATATTSFKINSLIEFPDKDKSYVISGKKAYLIYSDWTGQSYTSVIPSEHAKNLMAVITIYEGQSYSNEVFYPMIRSAEIEDDTFEPYSESELSYETSELFEGDSISAVGKLTRRFKKIVFNGTENIILRNQGDGTTTISFQLLLDNVKSNSDKVKSSHFINDSNSTNGVIGVCSGTNNDIYFEIERARLSSADVTGFKSWLKAQYDAGTPVTVVYELATPTEEEAPRTGNMILTKGINHVFSAGEFTPELDLEYSPDGYPLFDWLYLKPEDIGAAPAVHNHDDRYFTENELNARLGTQCTFVLEGTTLTITTK